MRKVYYSLATEERVARVTIFGDITSWPWLESDVSSYNLQHEIDNLDVDKIEVHINSYGGEVAEALAITNSLLRHPAEVDTFVDGFACSAATIVFMAGDRRVMSPFSAFLVHPAWTYIEGNADDLRKEANSLDAITEQSINAYMQRITRSRDELVSLMAEERFLTPEETLEWGFATEIDSELLDGRPTQSVAVLVQQKLTHPVTPQVTVQMDLDLLAHRLDEKLRAREEKRAEALKLEEPKEAEKPNLMNNFIKAFERKE